MEIEKKFQVNILPENLEQYQSKIIEQGYLCTSPIVRIRKSNDKYILTYKSKFGLKESTIHSANVTNEVEVLLDEKSYEHLKEKIDHYLIEKTRYLIPLDHQLTAELDIFSGRLKGLIFVEVEFKDEESAASFVPPSWFGKDVTFDPKYKNNYLSTVTSYEELTKSGIL